ncbi:UPF1 [Carpediemonas membranifera]|uniref:UPF1 n=1 Tax=Carpediemonas membranifera TaxID=201153 RepID=A0A8J6B7X4_9EUKA|nr:UPF1 [Carpediemonas membranifera]|eukprot:KAG9394994.1 UPF1 [Carpediemonas membranifera]
MKDEQFQGRSILAEKVNACNSMLCGCYTDVLLPYRCERRPANSLTPPLSRINETTPMEEQRPAEDIFGVDFDIEDDIDLDAMDFEMEGELLPEEHCSYCQAHHPHCLVRCNVCKKWFCNGRSGCSASHAVMHMIRSKHKEISLHSKNALGATPIECYNCGCKNIFMLGYVPAKKDNVVVLLCREPCLSKCTHKNVDWDVSKWEPLIQDRQLVDWLVKPPTTEMQIRCRAVTQSSIIRLEELWRTNPAAHVEELDHPVNRNVDPDPVLLRYGSPGQYAATFAPLIALEAEHDQRMKEAQSQDHVVVRWVPGHNKRFVAYFTYAKSEAELHLVPGDELRLRHSQGNLGPWMAEGHIIAIHPNEEIALELKGSKDPPPTHLERGFSIDFVWKPISFNRMQLAIRRLGEDSSACAKTILHALMGDPSRISVPIRTNVQLKGHGAPNLPTLNASQMEAVRSVLTEPLALVQGPPGTGKTVTAATIVYYLNQLEPDEQILVCAPSNVAVDQLCEKINATGVKVIRFCAKSREFVQTAVEPLTLHYHVQHVHDPSREELQRLQARKDEGGSLPDDQEGKLRKLRLGLERDILKTANVVAATCVSSGDTRLSKCRFKYVLIDESTQACEPEVLVPIVQGAEQLILVGDHSQLGPVIMCKAAARAGLSQSLYERLVLLGIKPHRLQVQYRMHPALSEFPSNTFYQGDLQNGVSVTERRLAASFPWPDADKPLTFVHTAGREELSASGTSYLNRTEAVVIEQIVTRCLKCGIGPDQIGVITPYTGQRAFVGFQLQKGELHSSIYQDIEISSVDGFQGREKDVIILSCVRSNEHQGIGFLADPRRLNVALTRAKYGLIIVGNALVLSQQPLWHALLRHMRERQLLVEGPLDGLQPVRFHLMAPKTKGQYLPGFGLDAGVRASADLYGGTVDLKQYSGYSPAMISGITGIPLADQGPYQKRPEAKGGPADPMEQLGLDFASQLSVLSQTGGMIDPLTQPDYLNPPGPV